MVHAHPGHEGDRALHPAGRQRATGFGDFRRGPVPVRRNDSAAEQEGAGSGRSGLQDSAGAGRHQAVRQGCEPDQLRARGTRRAGRGGDPGWPGRQRRGRRPADPGPARRRHHRRIGAPNPAGSDRPRRSAIRRAGSRGRRDPAGRTVRRAGRAHRAGRAPDSSPILPRPRSRRRCTRRRQRIVAAAQRTLQRAGAHG